MAENNDAGFWWASLAPLVGQEGPVTMLLGICREVARQERDPAFHETRLSLALQAIHGAEWRYDVRQKSYRGSDEIATLLGEPLPRPVAWAEWLERVHAQDLALFLAPPAPEGRVEFRFHSTAGELRWARCSSVTVTSETGEVEAVMGVMVDITQERLRETALAELVTQDALTGMLNLRGLWQNMDTLLVEDPSAPCLALFAIDMDHFKAINDQNGHSAGDAVLVEVARRLAAAGEGALCARLGGDEFIVVLRMASEVEAYRLRERLCQEFRRPVAFRGRWLPVSASIGVACMSGTIDAARLMDTADVDLYAQKDARGCPSTAA
ncbi:MAG: diguanylate cyclase domain-containing protein [Janthinobacterium lividum]